MKTNIHSKFLNNKTDEQLLVLFNEPLQSDEIKLAVIWILQERKQDNTYLLSEEQILNQKINDRQHVAVTLIGHGDLGGEHLPKSIKTAGYLIIANILIIIFQWAILSNAFEQSTSQKATSLMSNVILIVLFSILNVFLFQGKKWVRIAFSIIFGINIIFTAVVLFTLPNIYRMLPNLAIYIALFAFITTVLKIVSLILLFSKSANAFYAGNIAPDKDMFDQI
jgi:hypothetical protein